MKVKNLNKSSIKTKKLIKKVFAELLSEKKELSKISVSELTKRADINRSTFYSHYDDIYSVAEDYENELINHFFNHAELSLLTDEDSFFIDKLFDYIRENDNNYKMLCQSNDFLFSASKITKLASNKFLELCNNDKKIINKEFVDIEINVFTEGLICEYVRYCRGLCDSNLDKLYDYTKYWYQNFLNKRTKEKTYER